MTIFTRVFTATLALAAFATTVHAGPKAMTWVVKGRQEITNNGVVNPAGNPEWIIVGADTTTDAYAGDTADNQSRRILCFIPGSAPEPQASTSGNIVRNAYQDHFNGQYDAFYHAWSGGQIGLSEPYSGTQLTSLATADQFCATDVDPNARMLEHHDNGVGGWNVGGSIAPGTKALLQLRKADNYHDASNTPGSRFWVHINDQPANLWD